MDSYTICLLIIIIMSLLVFGGGLFFLYGKEELLVRNMKTNSSPEYFEKRGITGIQFIRILGRLSLAWSFVPIAVFFLLIRPMLISPEDVILKDLFIGAAAIGAYMVVTVYYFVFLGTKKKDY